MVVRGRTIIGCRLVAVQPRNHKVTTFDLYGSPSFAFLGKFCSVCQGAAVVDLGLEIAVQRFWGGACHDPCACDLAAEKRKNGSVGQEKGQVKMEVYVRDNWASASDPAFDGSQ